jgi:hypothetical protein
MNVLSLILALVLSTSGLQAGQEPSAVDIHIQQVIEQLPSESLLRAQLLDGARGNGVRFSWMDELRKRGIKRVLVGVDITFDRHGHPKQMSLGRTEYFTQYDFGGTPSLDTELLNAIRVSGLEKQLDALAMQKAAHGHWVDVPRPRPNPFVGGTQIEFLDDEWLPVLPTIYTLFRPGK